MSRDKKYSHSLFEDKKADYTSSYLNDEKMLQLLSNLAKIHKTE